MAAPPDPLSLAGCGRQQLSSSPRLPNPGARQAAVAQCRGGDLQRVTGNAARLRPRAVLLWCVFSCHPIDFDPLLICLFHWVYTTIQVDVVYLMEDRVEQNKLTHVTI